MYLSKIQTVPTRRENSKLAAENMHSPRTSYNSAAAQRGRETVDCTMRTSVNGVAASAAQAWRQKPSVPSDNRHGCFESFRSGERFKMHLVELARFWFELKGLRVGRERDVDDVLQEATMQ